MAEFYVTYEWRGERYLAIVVAPERPASLRFANADDLYVAMDALGHDWELWGSMKLSDEASTEWLQKMAAVGTLKRILKPDIYLAGQGGGGTGGGG